MDGRNLFESRAIKALGAKFAGPYPRPSVFISHSRLDKEKVRAVARALNASKVDYYFDENGVRKGPDDFIGLTERLITGLDYPDFVPTERSHRDLNFD